MLWIGAVLWGIQCIWIRDVAAVRCFNCKSYPSPSVCLDVTTCFPGESCYVEEIVTTAGRVVYDSGCFPQNRCSALGVLMGRRSSDITTCKSCCQGDLCNNAGCSKPAIPREQRGPYCYACDAMSHPGDCDQLSICKRGEQCAIYIPAEYHFLLIPLYRAECVSANSCGSLPNKVGECSATCCDTDFCNDQCTNVTVTPITAIPTTQISTVVTTTQTPPTTSTTTTTPTTPPTTTTPPPPTTTTTFPDTTLGPTPTVYRCRSRYDLVPNTRLCIAVSDMLASWENARAECQHDGGDLLVYETNKERDALNSYFHDHPHHGDAFWIGIHDADLNDHFRFVNGDEISHAMWAHNQPEGGNENCVRAVYSQQMRWADHGCRINHAYICQTDPCDGTCTDTIQTTTPPSTTNQGCSTHYHHVPETELCISIRETVHTWDDARANCVHDGGDLIVYKTDHDRHQLAAYIRTFKHTHHGEYWIGLVDDGHHHDRFEFVNGDSMSHTMWGSSQPDYGNEHCVRAYLDQTMRWGDRTCDSKFGYICQKARSN